MYKSLGTKLPQGLFYLLSEYILVCRSINAKRSNRTAVSPSLNAFTPQTTPQAMHPPSTCFASDITSKR
jgi:hypothetical protein